MSNDDKTRAEFYEWKSARNSKTNYAPMMAIEIWQAAKERYGAKPQEVCGYPKCNCPIDKDRICLQGLEEQPQ
ncbi:MAG: hypothetical protein R3332_00280 [Pseudohongiellaceae bacterium]|nr:hypothetical protein [Pseudohongiellaceae bacterium]